MLLFCCKVGVPGSTCSRDPCIPYIKIKVLDKHEMSQPTSTKQTTSSESEAISLLLCLFLIWGCCVGLVGEVKPLEKAQIEQLELQDQ